MDGGGEVKKMSPLIAVKVATDLGAVLAIVGVLGWILDNIDLGMLCCICGPLDGCTRPMDSGDNTVEEFKFWDKEMVDGFVASPNPCSSSKDGVLVLMKAVQCIGYFS